MVVVAYRNDKCTSQLPRALLGNPKEQLAMVSIKYVRNGQMLCMHTCPLRSHFLIGGIFNILMLSLWPSDFVSSHDGKEQLIGFFFLLAFINEFI